MSFRKTVRQIANCWAWSLLLLGGFNTIAQAEGITPVDPQLGRPVEFFKDLFPVLEAKCLACHNVRTHEGDLVLENVPAILKGAGSGKVVNVGQPVEKSPLFLSAARMGDSAMPPLPNKVEAQALTPKELGLLKKWIEEGAKPGTALPAQSTLNWQAAPSKIKAVFSLALTGDERFLAAGRSNHIVIYDLPAQKEIAQLTDPNLLSVTQPDGRPMYAQGVAHRDFVHALAFSPDGNLLASAGYREVKLWERQASARLQNLAAGAPVRPAGTVIDSQGVLGATILANNTVRLWNLTTGQPSVTLQGHAAQVNGVAFAPDSKTAVTASDDNTIRVWNLADGKETAQLKSPTPVKAISYNREGTQVIAAHGDNIIRIWATPQPAPAPVEGQPAPEPPKPIKEIGGVGQPITMLAMMPKTNEFYGSSLDNAVRVWNFDGGQVFGPNLGAPVMAAAVSPEGDKMAAVGGNMAKVWRRDNGQQLAEVKGDPSLDRVVIGFTDDSAIAKQKVQLADTNVKEGEKDVQGREESLKKAIEAKTKAEAAVPEAEKKVQEAEAKVKTATEALAAKPEDEGLKKAKTESETALKKEMETRDRAKDAVVSADRGIQLSQQGLENSKKLVEKRKGELEAAKQVDQQLDQTLNAAKQAVPPSQKPLQAIAFSPDGKQIATGGEDGLIQLWDAATGKALETLKGHQGPVTSLAFAPNGLLFSGSADQTAGVWDVKPKWKLAAVLGGKPENPLDVSQSPMAGRVLSLAFSPDGKRLITGGGDPSRSGELLIWDVASRGLIRPIENAHSDTVFDVKFSRDGKFIATGAADKFMKVFEAESGKFVRAFEGHTNHVLGVAWKADGATLASCGADNAIKLWNIETGEQRRTITNYDKQVTAITFVGTSEVVCSCGGDKTVKYHRSGDGGAIRNFGGMTDFVYTVVATREENLVIAAGEDGAIRVWRGKDGQLLSTFEPPPVEAKTANK